MSTTIYALIDPRTRETRYVGKTNVKMRIRFTSHMRDKRPSRKLNWLLSLKAAGLQPEIEVLEDLGENSPKETWQEAERFWISYLISIGARLTNLTIGGEGLHGLVFTEEHKRKIGDAHKGRKRSIETLTRMAESRRGIPVDHLLRYSQGQIGKKLSADHRAKIAAAGVGRRHSAETKARMSAVAKGKRKSQQARANMSIAQRKLRSQKQAHPIASIAL